MDTMPFTAADVLTRAIAILEAGPLTGDDAEHGPYCVPCAVARAKSQLDEEHGTGASLLEALIYDGGELASDMPLVEAMRTLGPAVSDLSLDDMMALTKAEAVMILRKGITST